MAKQKLTNDDFCRAAKRLRCEVAAIKAFGEVESKRAAFDDNGFPTILFERHKFYEYARNRKELFQRHPDLCNPVPGGYGKYADQKPKFDRAFALDPEAAMMACSWGMFQVMGFNWRDLGYASIDAFVDLMKSGEAAHLESFVRYIMVNHLADELRALDWDTLALRYNGPDYRKNRYHIKLPAAYKKFAAENIDCSQVSAAVPAEKPTQKPTNVSDNPPGELIPGENSAEQNTNTAQPPNPQSVVVEKEPDKPKGFFATLLAKITAAIGAIGGADKATAYAKDAQSLGVSSDIWSVVFYMIVGVLVIWIFKELFDFFVWPSIQRWRTNTLVTANSTENNTVMLARKEDLEKYEAEGWIVVRRG